MKLGIFATSGVLLAALSAHGAVLVDPLAWLTDIRRCTASFSGNGSGSSWQDRTVPFEEYMGGADIMVSNGVETWSANCVQESTMDGASVSFAGESEAVIIAGLLSNPLTAQAQSKLDLYFTIAEPTEYRLEGHVSEAGHSDSMAKVSLTLLGGDPLESVTSSSDSSRSFHMSGILEPGTYRLYAEALGKCRTIPMQVFAEGSARCSVEFTANIAPDSPEPPPRPRTTSSTDSPPPRQ